MHKVHNIACLLFKFKYNPPNVTFRKNSTFIWVMLTHPALPYQTSANNFVGYVGLRRCKLLKFEWMGPDFCLMSARKPLQKFWVSEFT